jgi:phosphoglycolate phosphatase
MKNIKLVIFDLDGTLIDAYEAIARSFNFTMRKCGYPERGPKVIRRAVGWGDRNLLKPFVKKADLDKALAIYRKNHRLALLKYCRLTSGSRRILDYLSKKGYRLAVASNRPTAFSRLIIRHLKLREYFSYVLCADKLDKGKPHPQILQRIMQRLGVEPEQTVYVGDMPIDAQAARRARASSVIVTTGSGAIKEILREKPFRVLRNILGLKVLL